MSVWAQTPEWAWVKSMGGPSRNENGANEYGAAVKCDNDGNIYMTGAFYDSVQFGNYHLVSNGENDMFLAKFDNAGNTLWAINAGGVFDDVGYSLAVNANGDLVVCGTYINSAAFGNNILLTDTFKSMFLATFDKNNGQCLRARKFGQKLHPSRNNEETLNAVFTDNQNNYYLQGNTADSIDMGSVYLKGDFIVKLDSNMNLLWANKIQKGYDTSYFSFFLERAFFVNSNGDCFTAGFFGNKIVVQSNTFSTDSLKNKNGYVAKFESGNGNLEWLHTEGGPFTMVRSISSNDTNGIYSGIAYLDTCILDNGDRQVFTDSAYHSLILKKDGAGNILWSRPLPIFTNLGNTIAADPTGGVIFMGFGDARVHGHGYRTYKVTAKFDDYGNQVWLRVDSADSDVTPDYYSSTTDRTGNFIVCGGFSSKMVLGTDTLKSRGGYDIFIAKLGNNQINAIKELKTEAATLNVFPNPNTGCFTVSLNIPPLPNDHCILQLQDISGRRIRSYPISSAEKNYSIDENLAAGSYYLNLLQNGNSMGTAKVLVTPIK